MTLVTQGFLLPDWVRSELGFQDAIGPSVIPLGLSSQHVVPGAFYEVVTTVQAKLTSDGTGVTRFPRLDFANADAGIIYTALTTQSQGGSATGNYFWNILLSSAFVVGITTGYAPLVPFILPPGYTVTVTASSLQAGDQFKEVVLVLQRYPTGKQPERDVTPLLRLPGFAGSTTPFPGGGGGASAPAGGGAAAPTGGGTAAPAAPATVQVAAPQYSGAPPGLAPGTRVE